MTPSNAHACAPSRRRIHRRDADDVACELLIEARARGYPLALFLLPNCEFAIKAARSYGYEHALRHDPSSLVGVYTGEAAKVDLIADIYARAEELGIEWPTLPLI